MQLSVVREPWYLKKTSGFPGKRSAIVDIIIAAVESLSSSFDNSTIAQMLINVLRLQVQKMLTVDDWCVGCIALVPVLTNQNGEPNNDIALSSPIFHCFVKWTTVFGIVKEHLQFNVITSLQNGMALKHRKNSIFINAYPIDSVLRSISSSRSPMKVHVGKLVLFI